MTAPKCIIDMMETRTIEAQIMQKLKNNEDRPKFTGSYKKKRVQASKFTNGLMAMLQF